MKITRKQIQKIIETESIARSGKFDFGSNSERQRRVIEARDFDEPLDGLVNSHLSQVERMMDEWELEIMKDRPDPRAEDIHELLFELQERMMAVLEGRE